ncbi:MAG: DUF6273 domain-containing protein [Lachnospiraceae bacterium]|nr:DUF6273 domain-containing protein [Lachnospiraceae bacterium]
MINRRIFSIGVSALLSISAFLTVIPQTQAIVYADSDKMISGLCTGAIANPSSSADWSYVYYGAYDGDPVKYRVLSRSTSDFGGKTMFLDSDSTIVNKMFDNNSKDWADSELKDWLNGDGFYNNTDVFTEQEKAAVTSSTKAGKTASDGAGSVHADYQPLAGEKVFLLDSVEATSKSYGYAGNDARIKNNNWWLRSPDNDEEAVGYMNWFGAIDTEPNFMEREVGVCPAFNLDLSSVIFSSVLSGSEYKLTIRDTDMDIATPGRSRVKRSGNVVTVPYIIMGANSGNATRVSVLLTDREYSAGTVATTGYSYQKLNVDMWGTAGTGKFVLPPAYANKTCGSDYYAYILAEDVNIGKATDYASAPIPIFIPDKDGHDNNEEPSKPAAVNPDTIEGYFISGGQMVPGLALGKTVQGPAAQAALNAKRPAGFLQAFTFNMAINGNVNHTLKNGTLTIIIPKELQNTGRTFALMALDKNGNALVYADSDTNPATITANINFEGYAFALIYKD